MAQKKNKSTKQRVLSQAEKDFLAGLSKFNFTVVNVGGQIFELSDNSDRSVNHG